MSVEALQLESPAPKILVIVAFAIVAVAETFILLAFKFPSEEFPETFNDEREASPVGFALDPPKPPYCAPDVKIV